MARGRLRPVIRKNKRLLTFLILLLVVAIASVTLIYLRKSEEAELAEKLAEKKRLELLVQEEKERAETIDDYKAYVQTKSYIEEVARKVLGLVYKDEIIFRPEGVSE